MRNPCRSLCSLLALLCAMSPVAIAAAGGAAGPEPEPREQIDVERARIEARYRQQRWECSQRFFVTACNEDARAEYRAASEALDRREYEIDSRLRHQRAQRRLQIIDEKTAALARLQSQAAPPPQPSSGSPATAADRARSGAAGIGRGGSAAHHDADAAREARERMQAAQRRREQAERYRAEREAATERDAASGLPPRPPIPLPRN